MLVHLPLLPSSSGSSLWTLPVTRAQLMPMASSTPPPVATSPSPERTGGPRSYPSCPACAPAPWELMPPLLILLGRWLGRNDHATMPPRSARRRGDHGGRARAARRLVGRSDRFSQWADPAGRSPCGYPATVHGRPPRLVGCSPGPVHSPALCAVLKIHFPIYLIPKMVANF
jgi:hypothetical protein